MFIRAKDMDVTSGMRDFDLDQLKVPEQRRKSVANLPQRTLRGLF